MHEGHRERMWNRLYFHGDSMSDHELLETLLFFAIPRCNTNPTAHALLDGFGSLEKLFEADAAEIEKIAGVGKKSAELIRVVGLLCGRARRSGENARYLTNAAAVRQFARERFEGRKEEALEFYFLGARGRLLCVKTFACGDGESVSVQSKQLSELLSSVQPLSLVVAHNHPSGNTEPSCGDDDAAREIYQICRIHGVLFSDCLVFADGCEAFSYFLGQRFERIGLDRRAEKSYIVMNQNKNKKGV